MRVAMTGTRPRRTPIVRLTNSSDTAPIRAASRASARNANSMRSARTRSAAEIRGRPGKRLKLTARSVAGPDDQAETVVGPDASAIRRFEVVTVHDAKYVERDRCIATRALAGVRSMRRTRENRLPTSIIERVLGDGKVDVARIRAAPGVATGRFADALFANRSARSTRDREPRRLTA